MADGKRISDEINIIPEHEWNYNLASDKEYNDLSEETSAVAERGGYVKTEYKGGVASRASATASSNLSGGNLNTASVSSAKAVKAANTFSSVLSKITLGLVAVTGAAVIGTSYLPAARSENAKFINVESYEREICMEIDVLKWSEDLKIRVTGKNFTDELVIENREKFSQYSDQQEYYQNYEEYERLEQSVREEMRHYYTYYYVEDGNDGDEILLEIIGNPVFMSEVIDSRTVVLRLDEPKDPDEPYDPVGSAQFISVETYDRYVYMQIEVTEWSEYLKIRVIYNGFIDYLEIENNGYGSADDQDETWISYYAESAEDGDEILLEIVEESSQNSIVLDSLSVTIVIGERENELVIVDDNGIIDHQNSGYVNN